MLFNNKHILILVVLFLIAFPVYSQSSPDAVAIRVIPNPNNYSALRWYNEQNFSGSPQSVMVDGYEAIRDGRTIYVNAANVNDNGTADTSDDELFTNIYLISYNQGAEQATIAIINQLINHWNFNTNITNIGNCIKPDLTQEGQCLVDKDCSQGDYCDSSKANITRDTRRLADLAEIKIALENYKIKNNKYPNLNAGSYLTGKTISTWSSWREKLGVDLGISIPIDPINKLGDCGDLRFNSQTCWDEKNQEFADSDLLDPELNLPANSNVYTYSVDEQGNSYNLCGVMKSGLITGLAAGACEGSATDVEYSFAVTNLPPEITGVNIPTAYAGEPFQAFIQASDPNGDSLTWTIDTSMNPWPMWGGVLLALPPALENTAVISQKAVRANSAGQVGNYKFSITVDDGRGLSATGLYTISVVNRNPPIIQPIEDHTLIIGKNLAFTILADDADNQYPLTFTFAGEPIGFNATGLQAPNLHDWNVAGQITGQTQTYNVSVIAHDLYLGESNHINFTITVQNNPPNITSAPNPNATACINYNYTITAVEPDGHVMTFNGAGLPVGLAFNTLTPTTAEITGIPTANPPVGGSDYAIQITVRDQYFGQTIAPYDADDVQNYNLHVVDEVFNVQGVTDGTVWVCATAGCAGLYFNPTTGNPLQYNTNASVTTPNTISYGISNAAHPVPAGTLQISPGFQLTIAPSGAIQGTPTNNVNDLGAHNFTVTAVNNCGASYTTSATVTVMPNQWCGDTIIQPAWGEVCESTDLGGKDCISQSFDAGTLACASDCRTFNTSGCCNVNCSGVQCGIDKNNCANCANLCGPNTNCVVGICACAANYGACDGSAVDADGCESDLRTDSNNCGGCGNACLANASCAASVCSCNAGWQDCDGNGSCECDVSGTGYCSAGACVNNCVFGSSNFGSCNIQ